MPEGFACEGCGTRVFQAGRIEPPENRFCGFCSLFDEPSHRRLSHEEFRRLRRLLDPDLPTRVVTGRVCQAAEVATQLLENAKGGLQLLTHRQVMAYAEALRGLDELRRALTP